VTAPLGFLDGHRLTVYSSRGCPDCVRLERWLRERGVPHDEVLIDAEPAAAERLERETGRQAVPHILVDGRTWVRGYHSEERSRLSTEKLIAELRGALTTAP
jgi:glutaredoxin